MPSPIGHTLAALALRWGSAAAPVTAEHRDRPRRVDGLTLACVAVAVLPDLDLLAYPWHRTVTHSLGATFFLMIVAAAVTGWVTGRIRWQVVLLIGAAHGSHVLLDWMGVDRYPPRGLQALWPFDRTWYISGWDVFLPTERRNALSAASMLVNLRAAARELLVLGPIAAAAWAATRTRRNRARISVPDDRRPPSAAAEDMAGI